MRYLLFIVVAIAVVGLLTGDRRMWGLFYALLGLAVVYTILKLTGVLEVIAPSRSGVL